MSVGAGSSPEVVAPASSIAFARLDLNPSLSQKLDIVRFARTVSDAEKAAGVHGTGPMPHTYAGVRAELVDALFGELPGPVPLRAWFTGRAAVDAYPDRAAPGGIAEVAILQYDDPGAMRRALSYKARTHRAGDGQIGFAVDTADSYVVVADSARLARRALAAGTAHPLAADPTFRADVASLPQHDDPGLVWVDVTASLAHTTTNSGGGSVRVNLGAQAPAVVRRAGARALAAAVTSTALNSTAARSSASGASALTSAGHVLLAAGAVAPVSSAADERLVVGLRIEPTAVDVQGRWRNAPAAQTGAAPRDAALDELDRLPANAVAALSMTGLGSLLGREYSTAIRGNRRERQELAAVGIGSAGDLRVLFGSVTTAALLPTTRGPRPVLTVAARSPHPARGLAVARRVLDRLRTPGGAVSLRTSDGRILLRTPATSRPAAGSGSLGKMALFRAAVPAAAAADALCFVNVARAAAADTSLSAHDRAELSPVTAVGFTSRGGPDPGFQLRITVR